MEGNPQPIEDLETKLIEKLKGVEPLKTSEVEEQCIYKVPPVIHEARPQAYTPKTISIGPFHNPLGRADNKNDNILWSMEDLKLKYLKHFLNRTELSVGDFVRTVQNLENRIRTCYADSVIYNRDDFLIIIITDACFIIELFLRHYEKSMRNDPILSKSWLCGLIVKDLILLENQLPFFVLEEIYKFVGLNPKYPSFVTITSLFFEAFNMQNINIEKEYPTHFVDLLRIFWKPSSFAPTTKGENISIFLPEYNPIIDHLFSVSQLSEAGLKFEVRNGESSLDLRFDDEKGVLYMPRFHVADITEIYFRNILAFEECHYPSSAYISQYLTILGFLIKTKKDVSILNKNGIIVNRMGDVSDVATMIHNLGKNVSMPYLNSNYQSLCQRLNAFYNKPLNQYWIVLRQHCFSNPWVTYSTIAAVFLLILTIIQTACSVFSVFNDDKKTTK